MMKQKLIRWGMIGSGYIAERWLCGAAQCTDIMQVVAIASLIQEQAKGLADKFGISTVEPSVEALLSRDDIDIVYVATPHTAHMETTLEALNHGKNVLCEKAMAVNSVQADKMIQLAKKKGLFLMEGMWTRFFPAYEKVKELLHQDVIGRLRSMDVSFAYNTDAPKTHRLLNPALAGGALLDVGVYCMELCSGLTDAQPLEMKSIACINSDENAYGVDEQDYLIARYPDEVLAHMSFAVKTKMGDEDALLSGSDGQILMKKFWCCSEFVLKKGNTEETFSFPIVNTDTFHEDTGFQYEIRHVVSCLNQQLAQSPVNTLEGTLATLSQCDAMRQEWHLVYPCE